MFFGLDSRERKRHDCRWERGIPFFGLPDFDLIELFRVDIERALQVQSLNGSARRIGKLKGTFFLEAGDDNILPSRLKALLEFVGSLLDGMVGAVECSAVPNDEREIVEDVLDLLVLIVTEVLLVRRARAKWQTFKVVRSMGCLMTS